jgi:hypothetical protein
MDKNTCYCCESQAIGQGDHVPPMSLFPNGAFSNIEPIIVPSCLEHNQNLSKFDEYLKFVLATSSEFTPNNVLESTVRGMMRHIKNNGKNLPNFGIYRNGQEVIMNDSIPIDAELLHKALEKIARGIYYHHFMGEKKLIGETVVFPIFLGIDRLVNDEDRKRLIEIYSYTKQDMEEYEMHGSFKEIFAYQVIESEDMVIINMKFYMNKVVSVMAKI